MTQKRTLLVVGALSENPAVYTYASSFIASFERLGFKVTSFNYRKKRLPLPMHAMTKKIHEVAIRRALSAQITHDKPDIIFCIKTEIMTPALMHSFKKNGARLFLFYPDSPFALWNGNSCANVVESLHGYNHVLIWSHELIPALYSAGCSDVHYFPFAYDAQFFAHTLEFTDTDFVQYASDVCFVGTWEPEREQWLTAIVDRLPHLNLAIWGNEWNHKIAVGHPLFKALRGKAIYKDEMRKAFMCSKINLNFMRKQNIQAHNMRTFEVPAAGAFLLSQRTHEQAHMLFEEGISIACFATVDELIQKIEWFLLHEQERLFILQQAFLRVQHFTLDEQLAKLEALRF